MNYNKKDTVIDSATYHNDISNIYLTNTKIQKISFEIEEKLSIYWFNKIVLAQDVEYILDAGGGVGKWSLYFFNKKYKVLMCDNSSKMIEEARKYLPDDIKIYKEDVLNLSRFYDTKIDCIYAQGDVISYCLYPYKAMNEFTKIIQDNGIIIVSFDNYWFHLIKNFFLFRLKIVKKILKHKIVYMNYSNMNYSFPSKLVNPIKLNRYMRFKGYQVLKQIGKPSCVTLLCEKLKIKNVNLLFKFEKLVSHIPICSRHIEIFYKKTKGEKK